MYFYSPLILTKTLKTLQLSPLLRICSSFYFFLCNTEPLRFISDKVRDPVIVYRPEIKSLDILDINCHISSWW